jgi:hypothetical protein
MAETQDIETHQERQEKNAASSIKDGIGRAMDDADRRITRLVDRLHNTARGSQAFRGAEADARRVLAWFEAKTHELDSELQKLTGREDRGQAQGRPGRSDAATAGLERAARQDEDRPHADTPGG